MADPARFAVVNIKTGIVTNAIMATVNDAPPLKSQIIADPDAISVQGDKWDGKNFIAPNGKVRSKAEPVALPEHEGAPETESL